MKIRDFELTIPIIQGGMGIGVSLGNLAGAVAANGAMGVISSVNAGYREEDSARQPVTANLRALAREIKSALKTAIGKGMVAVNIMVAVNHYEETVKAAIEAGVQIGTRFIATKECDATSIYKDVIVNAKPEDIVVVQSPVGMPGRALNTPLIQNLAKGNTLYPEICNECSSLS